jgi:hypothetical protein
MAKKSTNKKDGNTIGDFQERWICLPECWMNDIS